MRRADDAIADYNARLIASPDAAMSLYGRGIAKLLKGDATGGNADLTAARLLRPTIADDMAKLGVKP